MTSKRFVCPVCNFSCGRNKTFEAHLAEHGFDSIEKAYIDTRLNGIKPKCFCNSCNLTPTFRGWNRGYAKYVDGHSGRIYSALGEVEAQKIAEARTRKLRGRKGWSSGLTKETDKRLQRAASARSETMTKLFASGQLSPWAKGLTKETDERLAAHSQQLKQKFSDGELSPWAKGLTKETDERVWRMSLSVSRSHRARELRERLDALKRLDPNVIRERLAEKFKNEHVAAHIKLKKGEIIFDEDKIVIKDDAKKQKWMLSLLIIF